LTAVLGFRGFLDSQIAEGYTLTPPPLPVIVRSGGRRRSIVVERIEGRKEEAETFSQEEER
jgi:hypothetical protein